MAARALAHTVRQTPSVLPYPVGAHSMAVNPFSKEHGAPEDEERHVGDLGNFKTDGQGNAQGSVQDKHLKLIGQQSIIGVCQDAGVDVRILAS